MNAFIVCNLFLAILVQNQSPYLALLTTPLALGIGVTGMAASVLAGYLKKVPSLIWHDGFATATLMVWYGYWKPQFDEEAPMFFIYPVYFALLTSILTLVLINKSRYFDHESIEHLRYMEKIFRFDISAAVAFVVISLLIAEHYALFLVAMTFYIIRHSIMVCLENIEG